MQFLVQGFNACQGLKGWKQLRLLCSMRMTVEIGIPCTPQPGKPRSCSRQPTLTRLAEALMAGTWRSSMCAMLRQLSGGSGRKLTSAGRAIYAYRPS